MTQVADMLPGLALAASIRRLLEEDIPSVDKELSVQSFNRTVDPEELTLAWGYLESHYRAAYKYWCSRVTE